MNGILFYYFGWPDGAVWSNLLASAICAVLVWWRLHRQAVIHHAEVLAQAARHHAERRDQAAALNADLKQQLAAHCADLKEHAEATAHLSAAVAVPQQLLDDIKNRNPPRKPGGT